MGSIPLFLLLVSSADAATSHLNLSYDIDSSASGSLNQLDLYTPEGVSAGDSRPVVVFVHGGGWRIGDKKNKIANKVDLFTGSGYVFASVNYRLSPVDGDPANPDPARIRFPAHPPDVGEAIGWLDRHVADYGGDPKRILLIGHSAGAQIISLVATDPSYVEDFGVKPWQLIGAIPLDTDAFDIAQQATQSGNDDNRDLIWNAFATPAENAATGVWLTASATHWASPDDPDFLFVTSANPGRLGRNQAMASALGQDPNGVFVAPYDHEGINDAVGNPSDASGETQAITDFVARMVKAAIAPKTRLTSKPSKTIETRRKHTKVRIAFSTKTRGATFECRLDAERFKRCTSPRKLQVTVGAHTFKVRSVSDRGRPGKPKGLRFRVVRK